MKLLRSVAYILIVFVTFPFSGVFAATLGEALDNTNLVWTTSSSNAVERPWFVETNANPFDGVDDAVSGTKNIHGVNSWLETTVVGPGILSYWCRVSSEETMIVMDEEMYFDYLTVEINGSEVNRIAGPCGGWVFRAFEVPEGTNVVRWTYVKDEITTDSCGVDQVRLDQVKFEQSTMPLGMALDTCGRDWVSGATAGSTYWFGQTNRSANGKAAESALVNANEESWLQVTVAGVSNVSFLWRVSSRTNADYLEFYTNSYVHNPVSPPANYATRISGEVTTWRSNFFQLSAAVTNTLTWRYVRSNQTPVGENRGWLDQVKFGPDPERTPFTLAAPVLLSDGQFQFSLVGKTNCNCLVEVSTNLVHWSPLVEVFTTSDTTTILDADAASAPERFYRGKSQ